MPNEGADMVSQMIGQTLKRMSRIRSVNERHGYYVHHGTEGGLGGESWRARRCCWGYGPVEGDIGRVNSR